MTWVLVGCFPNSKSLRKQNPDRYLSCQQDYIYQNFEGKKDMRVLLFNKKFQSGTNTYPNFLIGIVENDTIGFIDKSFTDNIEPGMNIQIQSSQWSEIEKDIYKPVLALGKDTKINELYCSIKYVFYGELP